MTIRVAISEGTPENIVCREQFATGLPEETLPKVVAWLQGQRPFAALGIASFGPIDPRKGSATYGHITSSPKVQWRNTDVVGALDVFGVPVGFDTDVNAPAMFEFAHAKRQPGGHSLTSTAYITVGTGVGVGLVVNGAPVHGMLHPEGGYVNLFPLSFPPSFSPLFFVLSFSPPPGGGGGGGAVSVLSVGWAWTGSQLPCAVSASH